MIIITIIYTCVSQKVVTSEAVEEYFIHPPMPLQRTNSVMFYIV